jgi:hypothetical protein
VRDDFAVFSAERRSVETIKMSSLKKIVFEFGDAAPQSLHHCHHAGRQRLVYSEIRFGKTGFVVKGKIEMKDITISLMRGDFVDLKLEPIADDGGPGNYQKGTSAWSLPNPRVSIAPVPGDESNELTRRVTALGDSGPELVTCTIDADPGDGEVDIVGTATLLINLPNATGVNMTGTTPAKVNPPAQSS